MNEQRKIPDFSHAKVLVIGDVMLDRNWFGSTKRISPEAPVPVVNIGDQKDMPGGAANVAVNIAGLGGSVTLCGLIGNDDAGKTLQNLIERKNIKNSLVCCDAATIMKLRVISHHQQLIRLDFEDDSYQQYSGQLKSQFESLLDQHDVIVFSDYGKGTLNDVRDLIALAKNKNKKVLVDPKGSDFDKYHAADIVTPNLSELKAVTGAFSEEDLISIVRQQIDQTGIASFLVTLSEKGLTYISGEKEFHLDAQAREVFDVTGAGDTVIATLATSLSAGYGLEQSLIFANAAASVVVGKLGTADVSPYELRQALEPERAQTHGVVSEAELQAHIQRVRERGQTIVMTNGCFDILHAGHVTYLEEAKALGDRLIVAVNTDESVRRLKGPTRPANNLESRAKVLAALQSVDWVVVFDSDTPEALIQSISPDILVKGGDNQVENIPGAQWVLDHGGSVKILSYVDGFSTSKTLNKYDVK